MKKIVFIVLTFAAIIGMSSCHYDDSNDIDVLNPNDTIQTSTMLTE